MSTVYHNFVFQPGYVEDAVLSIMQVSHQEGFPDVESALEHFRLCLVSYLTDQMCTQVQRQSPCCQNHMGTPEYKFCPVCGKNLQAQVEPQPADVQDLFMTLPMTQCSDGCGILYHFEVAGWNLTYHIEPKTYPPVYVQAVGRWMGRDTDPDTRYGTARPWCQADYPDGNHWNSRDGQYSHSS